MIAPHRRMWPCSQNRIDTDSSFFKKGKGGDLRYSSRRPVGLFSVIVATNSSGDFTVRAIVTTLPTARGVKFIAFKLPAPHPSGREAAVVTCECAQELNRHPDLDRRPKILQKPFKSIHSHRTPPLAEAVFSGKCLGPASRP